MSKRTSAAMPVIQTAHGPRARNSGWARMLSAWKSESGVVIHEVSKSNNEHSYLSKMAHDSFFVRSKPFEVYPKFDFDDNVAFEFIACVPKVSEVDRDRVTNLIRDTKDIQQLRALGNTLDYLIGKNTDSSNVSIINEVHEGVVTEVIGSQFEVTYETKTGPIKQLYHRDQTVQGIAPSEGSAIRASVTISLITEQDVKKIDLESDAPIPSLKSRAVAGPIKG